MIAIIPARGGSKAIPRKNVIPFCGKPLIAWTIEQAMMSSHTEDVVVTTDDDEIAFVADRCGAVVFRRSPETATDNASSESAIIEVLNHYPSQHAVFLQVTSPLRQPEDIDSAIEEYLCGPYDSLFSCCVLEGYTWTLSERLIPNYIARVPRQHRADVQLMENGSIYVFSSDGIRRSGNRIHGRVGYYLMSPLDSLQLDRPADIEMMEQLARIRLNVSSTTTTY